MVDSSTQNPPQILFIAGDLSGDRHTALVMSEIAQRHSNWKLFGVGGQAMSESGATILGDSRDCGVIGMVPSLMLVPRLLQMRRRVLDWCKTMRPQLVVLCDWGAFNARLLQPLQALQIPTLYYFPPGSWRKKGARGLSIAPFVSRVATPFEWSAKRLQEAGANAEWVGHPILETARPLPDQSDERLQLRREFGVEGHEKLVALMPGSRSLEVRAIAPHLAGTVDLLRKRDSSTRFVVAVPKNTAPRVRPFFPDVMIVEGRATDLLMACDAAVVKSGTSTLEAAAADAPQVVVYDAPAALRAQWRLMGGTKKIPFVAMPNIIVEREIVPELLGDRCRPQQIVDALTPLLHDSSQRQVMREGYVEVRRALGTELPQSATKRMAAIIEEMVEAASSTRTRNQ